MRVDHQNPRYAGIDYGEKRVGVALSDPLHLFAQADGTFSPDEAIRRLVEIEAEHGLAGLVIGWPLTLDGQEGESTEKVKRYVEKLTARFPEVPVTTWDERFTSEMARRLLAEVGVSRKARRRKGRIDRTAAAIILQEFLDELRSVTPD